MSRILAAIAEGIQRGNHEADMLRGGWKVARRPAPSDYLRMTWYWREETRGRRYMHGYLRAQPVALPKRQRRTA